MTTRPVLTVARWSFAAMLWAPRTLPMALLALTPVLIAIAYRIVSGLGVSMSTTGFGVFSFVTAAVGFPFVAPMLTLFYASGIVSDELEAGTMTFYLSRPVSREAFVAGKMLASLFVSLVLFLPALVASYYLVMTSSGWSEIGARFPSLAQDAAAAFLGIAAYNGLFSFAGTLLRRPLLAGLIFIFGWQAAAAVVPGIARYFTVSHYLVSLLPHESFSGALSSLLGGRSSALTSVVALAVIASLSHGVAVWVFGRKEILTTGN